MSSSPKPSKHVQPVPAPARPKKSVLWAVVAALALVAIIAYAVLRHNQAVPGAATTAAPLAPPLLSAGSKAPDFSLRTGIGTFSSGDLAGKPYLLEIFATWCPHCQRMTAVLRAVRAKIPESRLSMVSVTGSPYGANSTPDQPQPESQADVDAFESAYHVTWPTLFDPDLQVADKFGLDGFPTIFVVNAKGIIAFSSSGEVPASVLLGAIHKAGA